MPTPLLPPPTPLLSALPHPPHFPLPSPSAASSWSPAPASPLLSSSAPAELPSFQLESASSAARLLSSSASTQRKSGVSLLSSSATLSPASASLSPLSSSSPSSSSSSSATSCSPSDVALHTPLLAAALRRQGELQPQPPALLISERPPVASAEAAGWANAEALNALLALKPASVLAHSHSFSVGEEAAAGSPAISLSSSSSSSPSAAKPLPSPRAAGAKAFSPASPDLRSMSRLTSFSSLLQHATPDTYIVLDLDETVYCGHHQPCAMMTERGLQRYQSIITSHPDYRSLPFASKASLTRALQAAVSRKRGVEADTISTIKQLQAKGVPVFALTARFSSMIATTKLELASLSLDLSLTSPFRHVVRDLATNAVISDGVIFTNANEKGPLLNRFLARALFDKHLKAGGAGGGGDGVQLMPAPSSPPLPSSKPITIPSVSAPAVPTSSSFSSSSLSSLSLSSFPSSSSSRIVFKTSKRLKHKKLRGKFDDDDAQSAASSSPYPSSLSVSALDGKGGGEEEPLPPLPRLLVFVDDRLQNCVSVMNGLRCTQQLGIGLLTYHYTPQAAAREGASGAGNVRAGQRSSKRGAAGLGDGSSEEDEEMLEEEDCAGREDDDEEEEEEEEDARLLSLADYQIHHFIRTKQILRDAAAMQHRRRAARLGASPTTSPDSGSAAAQHQTSACSPDSSPQSQPMQQQTDKETTVR